MNDIKISIIIKSNHDISAIASLLQQNNNSWECFIVNNELKNIEQYITNDKRFKILNDDISNACKHSNGEYILLINSNDIFLSDAFDNILHAIELTNADVIKLSAKNTYSEENQNKKYRLKYIFDKNSIMENVFDSLSVFCFKKNIVSEINIEHEHTLLTNILTNAKDMTVAETPCMIQQQKNIISAIDIIKNYETHGKRLSKEFWKKYFKTATSIFITQTIKSNDKKVFMNFCKQIPLNLIPLRYRFICYILKKTNK